MTLSKTARNRAIVRLVGEFSEPVTVMEVAAVALERGLSPSPHQSYMTTSNVLRTAAKHRLLSRRVPNPRELNLLRAAAGIDPSRGGGHPYLYSAVNSDVARVTERVTPVPPTPSVGGDHNYGAREPVQITALPDTMGIMPTTPPPLLPNTVTPEAAKAILSRFSEPLTIGEFTAVARTLPAVPDDLSYETAGDTLRRLLNDHVIASRFADRGEMAVIHGTGTMPNRANRLFFLINHDNERVTPPARLIDGLQPVKRTPVPAKRAAAPRAAAAPVTLNGIAAQIAAAKQRVTDAERELAQAQTEFEAFKNDLLAAIESL